MPIFNHPEFDAHEEVAFGFDEASGLKAVIAIHSTARGPAVGGCRMLPYADEAEALTDALRLARGMTYKSALAELPYGGGKAVIIADPHTDKTEALFLAMGRFVDSLGGRYISAEDVGVSVEDVEIMERVTKHVAGTCAGGAGDPSPSTAYGVLMGIKAAVAHKLGRNSLDGVRVAVQGLGHVGYHLCRFLAEAGAKLTVTDIDRAAIERAEQEFHARAVKPDDIYGVDGEVFSPCALGAVINDRTIAQLKAPIVAGSANNQLAEARHGNELARHGILYAPDYVINAGGIINISHEGAAYDKTAAVNHVAKIHDILREIFSRADANGLSTSEAADHIAEERIKSARAA